MKIYKFGIVVLLCFAAALWFVKRDYELKVWELETRYKNEITDLEYYYKYEIETLTDSIETLHNQNL